LESKIIGVIEQALSEARRALLEGGSRESLRMALGRGAYGDITLRLDKLAEDAIISVIRRHMPDATIVSEEVGTLGSFTGEGTIFLIDPIDGSTNASRGIPVYSTSITAARGTRFENIVAAGVINHINGDVILGEIGGSVTLNHKEASPSKLDDPRYGCIAINFTQQVPNPDAARLMRLASCSEHPRFLGSAALEGAYVAVGVLDAFVQPYERSRYLDAIPAIFLTKLAKGFIAVFNTRLEDLNLMDRKTLSFLVAGNTILGEKLLRLLQGDQPVG